MLEKILSFTRLGKAIDSARVALDGKKTYLVGVATLVPAVINLILEFQKDGVSALTHLSDNRNYELLMLGLGMLTGRAALTKAADPAVSPSKE